MNQLVDRHGNPITTQRRASPIRYARITRDYDNVISQSGLLGVTAPEENVDWKLQSFTEEQLSGKSFRELLNILIDSCPDLNAALSIMQMYVATHYELSTLEDDDAAQAILDGAVQTMALERNESVSVKLHKMVASGYLKGALHWEVVFDDNTDEFIDVPIVDPLRVRFNEVDDGGERGQHKVMGQEIDGDFIPFDSQYVHYLPLNPIDDKPFGRSMVSAAIFPMIFLLGLIKSGRQVIETQAWPYQIGTVDPTVYKELGFDDTEIEERVDALIEKVAQEMKDAGKGDQFVFESSVDIQHVGVMGRNNLNAIEMIEAILKRWIILALRQIPLLFGIDSGNALSTSSEYQLESFAIFIGSFQDSMEEAWTTAFTQILRRAGSSATPVFKLQRINSLVERHRLERFNLKVQAVTALIQNGVITPNEGRTMIRIQDATADLTTILEGDAPGLPEPVSAEAVPRETE